MARAGASKVKDPPKQAIQVIKRLTGPLASSRDELPVAAQRYVDFVERELEVPVELVGVGAARERVLA